MSFKIIDNKDAELRESAEIALKGMKDKYGKRYCPCALEISDDFICPCKPFLSKQEECECNCGRYEKIIQ